MWSAITFWITEKSIGLWPLVWHFGLGGVIIAACLAFYFAAPAWLLPGLRKLCLPIAGVFALAMASYAVGISNEHSRMAAQTVVLVRNATEVAERARAEAEAAVAAQPLPVREVAADCVPVVSPPAPVRRPGWVRAPAAGSNEPWNRDTHAVQRRPVRPVAKHPLQLQGQPANN